MITAWLTYCLLVSALLGAAAWAAERGSRAQGWSGRWPWAAALAGSIGLPLGAWLRPAAVSESTSTSVLPLAGAYLMESIPVLTLQPAAASGPSLETVLLWLWAATTAVLLLYLAGSALRVRAEGRQWRRGEVDGVEVLVSEATGPAALGLFRGRVVLPEWALALDDRLRRLLVLHEAEHVRARDPQLAVLGLVTCALMPWNVVLWWQLARLRLAIEMDCDARVLRRSGDPASYGSLLLEVGQRRRARLAVGLAESRSMLERRIRMITKTTKGRRTLRALGLGGLSVLVLAVACETPAPTGLADEPSRPATTEQLLAQARALAGEPVVLVDAERVGGLEVLDGLRPVDIEQIDIVGAPPGAAGQDRGSDHVLVLTRGASPEVQDRMRRIRETLMAERTAAMTSPSDRDITAGPTFTPMTARPALRNSREVQQALQSHYPPLLRDAGIGGTAKLWFLIDEDGAVQDVRIQTSSGYDALDQAALAVADVMEFTPAYNRDQRVPVWVALAITFEVPGAETGTDVRRDFDLEAQQQRQRVAEQAERRAEIRRELDAMRERIPSSPAGQPVDRDLAAGPTFTPMTERPQLRNAAEVQQALQRHYPPLLRDAGIGGTAKVWLFIGADGRVLDTRINAGSGHEALDAAALQVAGTMEFTPARNRGDTVPVWVALDITFDIQ